MHSSVASNASWAPYFAPDAGFALSRRPCDRPGDAFPVAEVVSYQPGTGLCSDCIHARLVESARGSTFVRCARANADSLYPKYPPLPVLRCPGYEPGTTEFDQSRIGTPPAIDTGISPQSLTRPSSKVTRRIAVTFEEPSKPSNTKFPRL